MVLGVVGVGGTVTLLSQLLLLLRLLEARFKVEPEAGGATSGAVC